MSDSGIICANLSFSWPDDTPVFEDLSCTVGAERTGLVAPNGTGKTTLLRLGAGELRPKDESVSVEGTLGYLPQNLPLTGDLTVSEVLGIAPVSRALDAIAAGDTGEEHYTAIGDDRDIEERTADGLGLGDLPLTRRLDTLSGGRVVSLGLAARLLKRPGGLLLDEPTNNLDLDARGMLYKTDDVHGRRLAEAGSRLDEAGRMPRDDRKITLEPPDTSVPAGRTIFLGAGIQVRYAGRPVFDGAGVDLPVRGPARIAPTGPNGAGKPTLLRVIDDDLDPESGEIKRADGRVAYLSQRLGLLDPGRTVAENFAAFAPRRPDAERMNLLARFLFRAARVHLPVGVLSGGERLRAALACVLCAEPAPRLLVLDEPTDNLGLDGVAWLEGALGSYEGAFLVVGHEERFLREIGVNRRLRPAGGRLTETGAPGGA